MSALRQLASPLSLPPLPITILPLTLSLPSMAPSTRRSPAHSISPWIFVPAPIWLMLLVGWGISLGFPIFVLLFCYLGLSRPPQAERGALYS